MRYLIQFLIPALVLIGVIYVVLRSRNRRSDNEQTNGAGDGEKATFIVILVIGALVAIGIVYALFGEAGA